MKQTDFDEIFLDSVGNSGEWGEHWEITPSQDVPGDPGQHAPHWADGGLGQEDFHSIVSGSEEERREGNLPVGLGFFPPER